jgi:hypothetical protein
MGIYLNVQMGPRCFAEGGGVDFVEKVCERGGKDGMDGYIRRDE